MKHLGLVLLLLMDSASWAKPSSCKAIFDLKPRTRDVLRATLNRQRGQFWPTQPELCPFGERFSQLRWVKTRMLLGLGSFQRQTYPVWVADLERPAPTRLLYVDSHKPVYFRHSHSQAVGDFVLVARDPNSRIILSTLGRRQLIPFAWYQDFLNLTLEAVQTPTGIYIKPEGHQVQIQFSKPENSGDSSWLNALFLAAGI